MGQTYERAGVDLAAGDEAVERIKPLVRSTTRSEVLGGIGGFGGLFALDTDTYRQPVLVSATDGVGTKVLIAERTGRLSTVGIDLVAMCVDDIACQGAEPLFFLDYISVGRLDPERMEQLVEGVAEGCRQAGCALVGGEMAEHPGAMEAQSFDLVGFAVGVVERDRIITGERLAAGDVLLGLHSPGLRSNGYSLARHVLFEVAGRGLDDPAYPGAPHTVADELLRPSVVYAPALHALAQAVDVHAAVHVTGGGIPGNLGRVLRKGIDAEVDVASWERPPIFGELQRLGDVTDEEMARVFNLGVGMIVAVEPGSVARAHQVLEHHDQPAVEIGRIVEGQGRVRFG